MCRENAHLSVVFLFHFPGPCNTQDDATLPMLTGETTAFSQAAGDRPDFSESFVFAPLKLPGLDKDGEKYKKM